MYHSNVIGVVRKLGLLMLPEEKVEKYTVAKAKQIWGNSYGIGREGRVCTSRDSEAFILWHES